VTVVVNGVPRYGDPALMQATAAPKAKFKLAGKDRRFAIPNPEEPTKAWTWKEITGLLKAVVADPKTAINKAEARLRAYAGRMNAPDAPLLLALDMPTGFCGLVHDSKFFFGIDGRGFHGGLLNGLKRFYQ
jgi:hypothetical protein